MKVLIVDDYPTMLKVLQTLLRQLGFINIEVAGDGVEALEKLKQDTFGLVVSDWNMEPMTGLELLKIVRSDPAMCDLPFIMITAESSADNVKTAKDAGVSNYIIKPFTGGGIANQTGQCPR